MSRAPAAIPREELAADREATERLFSRLEKGRLLLGYQGRTLAKLRSGVSLLVIEKSRRIGLTWGVAAFAALLAAAQPSAGGDNVFYMGYEQEMAREFIDACAMWSKAYGIAAGAVGEEVFEDLGEDGKTTAIKAFRIVFSSGFKIVALSSMPRAFRGKQGTVILDEAAFHSQLEEKIKAALALLMWGGQVVIISTHDGVANPFNELIDKIRAGQQKGEVLRISFDDAIADGLYERIAEVAAIRGKKVADKADWIADIRGFYGDNASEELDVIPKVGSGSLIKPEHIAACEHPEAGRPELYSGGLYTLGRDVARRRDGQVQVGLERVGALAWERDLYDEIGQTFAHQDEWFDARFGDRRMIGAGIDQTGMGEKVVEDAQLRHGANRVIGFLLTGPTRLMLGLGLAEGFERGLIRIAPDPRRRADLRAIKRVATKGDGVRLANDDTVHADYFWALAIAYHLIAQPAPEYGYTPASALPGRAGPMGWGSGRGRSW
jgi:phage FluMu gp28-like protein